MPRDFRLQSKHDGSFGCQMAFALLKIVFYYMRQFSNCSLKQCLLFIPNVFNLNYVDPIRSSLLSNNLLAKTESFLVLKTFLNTNYSFTQSCQLGHVKDHRQISFLMLIEFKESHCRSPETSENHRFSDDFMENRS